MKTSSFRFFGVWFKQWQVSSLDEIQCEMLWKVGEVFFVVVKQFSSLKKSFLRLCQLFMRKIFEINRLLIAGFCCIVRDLSLSSMVRLDMWTQLIVSCYLCPLLIWLSKLIQSNSFFWFWGNNPFVSLNAGQSHEVFLAFNVSKIRECNPTLLHLWELERGELSQLVIKHRFYFFEVSFNKSHDFGSKYVVYLWGAKKTDHPVPLFSKSIVNSSYEKEVVCRKVVNDRFHFVKLGNIFSLTYFCFFKFWIQKLASCFKLWIIKNFTFLRFKNQFLFCLKRDRWIILKSRQVLIILLHKIFLRCEHFLPLNFIFR